MERESGYYWVKSKGEWEIAEWYNPYPTTKGYWLFTGSEDSQSFDSAFEEIDERRIVRDENPEEIDYSCGSCSNSPCTCED